MTDLSDLESFPFGQRVLEVAQRLYDAQLQSLRGLEQRAAWLLSVQTAVTGVYISAWVTLGRAVPAAALGAVALLLAATTCSVLALWPRRFPSGGFLARDLIARCPTDDPGTFDAWLAYSLDDYTLKLHRVLLLAGRWLGAAGALTVVGLAAAGVSLLFAL